MASFKSRWAFSVVLFLTRARISVDDIACSLSVSVNACYRLPRLIQVRHGPREPTQTGVGIGHDGGERLVDLVSNRGRQLSHRHDPCDASRVRLRLVQGLFGALAL